MNGLVLLLGPDFFKYLSSLEHIREIVEKSPNGGEGGKEKFQKVLISIWEYGNSGGWPQFLTNI